MRLTALLAICLLAEPGAGHPPQQVKPLPTALPAAKRAAAQPASSQDLCGDLLRQYATKPAGVVFRGCAKGQGQTVVVATYQVSGPQSARAEKFFHENYGMGKLKFLCCGWEPEDGKEGEVKSPAFKEAKPGLSSFSSNGCW